MNPLPWFGTSDALAKIKEGSGLLTIFLMVAVLFLIPRISDAGYSVIALVLYCITFGTAMLVLSVDFQTLYNRVRQ